MGRTVKKLRNQKAPGSDGITEEVFKILGELGIDMLHSICQKIWTSDHWPEQWCHSIVMPLYKKVGGFIFRKIKPFPLDCRNYRTIALISHTSKVMLTILNERLKTFLLPQIPNEQTGERNSRTDLEHPADRRKDKGVQRQNVHVLVDYKKAFDKVKWSKLWPVLIEMGTPRHLVHLIQQLCAN